MGHAARGVRSENIPPGRLTAAGVQAIFHGVLGTTIGIHDDFFDAGGDSLLAEQVVCRVSDQLGIELPSTVIFDYPTAAELAEFLDSSTLKGSAKANAIQRSPQPEYRASFAQERLWLLYKLQPRSPAYNLCDVYELRGKLNVKSLERALHELVHRHESLRTTFKERNGEPVQCVAPDVNLAITHLDLANYPEQEKETLIRELLQGEARRVLELETGPLFRCLLLRFGEETHILALTIHHIVSDRWSRQVMLSELTHMYEAFSRNSPVELRELQIQYGDFAEWQRRWMGGTEFDKQANYWREQLAGAPEMLELPTDHPRGTVQDARARIYRFELGKGLSEQLRKLSQKEGATLFMTLLAGFQILMARYCRQEDLCVGSPIAGRIRQETEDLIGFFVNTLILRGRLAGNPAFSDLLKSTRETALGAYSHQDMPFHQLVSLLRPERSVTSTPFVQVMFALQNVPKRQIQSGDLILDPVRIATGVAKFDLSLMLEEEKRGITGYLEFNAGLFESATIERMMDCYVRLLTQVAVNPGCRIYQLKMLDERRRRVVLEEWNATDSEYKLEGDVVSLTEKMSAAHGEALAVAAADSRMNYCELNARANQLAYLLQQRGVAAGSVVAICTERSAAMITCMLGVLKSGAAYLPVDPSYPAARVSYSIKESNTALVLTQSHLRHLFSGGSAELLCVDGWQLLSGMPESNLETKPRLTDRAYVIYTSGSTGRPKGVMISHRSLLNLILWHQHTYKVNRHDRASQIASAGFDACVWEIWPYLTCGSSIFVVEEETKLLPETLQQWLVNQQITMAFLPTPLAELLLGNPWPAETALRALLVGGDRLTRRPPKGLAFPIINHYGPTEATVVTTAGEVAAGETTGSLPDIGKPISNYQVYILDPYLEPVPIGVPGEIHIGGEGVAMGYFQDSVPEQPRFIENPFGKGLLYRSGDLARYRSDGCIDFIGRADEQVKIRGYRIELAEIKSVLEQQEVISEAAVVLDQGRRGASVVAYLVVRGNAKPDLDSLRTALRNKLPHYMQPASFVLVPSLPLTPNGKLDRTKLASLQQTVLSRSYVAPQTAAEKILGLIWSEILSTNKIGIHDNFFELGGDSLLAVRVMARLREALGVELAISDLFARPVLADLARSLESAAPSQLPAIARVGRGGRLPLSFAQQRLWFLAQTEGASQAYHIAYGLRLEGELHEAALREALDRILARHEALRTTFTIVDGEPIQRIIPIEDSRFYLVEHDLRQRIDGEGELEHLVAQEARTPFDLETGPLIRGRLIRLAEDRHTLLITMHHIVSDEWSMGVLMKELSVLYGAFVRGEADPLPELSLQYADYAIWQREWMKGDILRQQADYWKTTLIGAPVLLQLLADYARPAQQDYTGALAGLVLNEKLTASLKEISKQHGTTLYMTLLAGWGVLLGRLSGEQDVVIGTPVANRRRVEIEGLIGFFVNTLALRLDLSGSPTVGDLLERVKKQAVASQQHQDIPFEQVVDLVRPVRSLSHSPLFQVMFVWQNASVGQFELSGLEVKPVESAPRVVAKFDLTLSLQEVGGRIVGGLEYATALFQRSTIERYLGYFRTLLEAMVGADTQAVDRLSLLSKVERDQLLYGWNDTRVQYPSDKCVHELFEEQVVRAPEATAIVFEEASFSYAELNARSNRLAHYLRELGVKPDVQVAICVERGFEMIVALLGILKAGGAYVPLDPAYPTERLSWMLEDSAPAVLLTQGHLQGRFTGIGKRVTVLDMAASASLWTNQPETNLDRASVGLMPEHLAYVIYTSGSTGTPKGVMISHQNLVSSTFARSLVYGELGRFLLLSPLSFDSSVAGIFGALTNSGTLLIATQDTVRDPFRLNSDIQRLQADTLLCVPSLYQKLLECSVAHKHEKHLSRVIVAGETCPPGLVVKSAQAEPQAFLFNEYGPTEGTVWATVYRCRDQSDTQPVPIGRPIANTRIYVLDSQKEPVPVGVAGELYIGGAGVGRGYLNRPTLTAAHFLKDPFVEEAGARMYKTGDLGRWLPDGNIEFLGRNDFQVKIRGFRIELGEIETQLAEHPGVREAVVIAREDAPGEKRLVAYYTSIPRSDEAAEGVRPEELRGYLAARLPEYMVPAAYVRLERLPLTENEKLDRKALPTPECDAHGVRGYEAPMGETEATLAAIWVKMLQVKQVGRHDNFFELGGHSLLAMQLVSQASRRGLHVTVSDVFRNQSIAELSAVAKHAEAGREERSDSGGNCYPLTPMQRWFFEQEFACSTHWNAAMLFDVQEVINLGFLRQAIDKLIDKHEALRLQFRRDDEGEWVQYLTERKDPNTFQSFDLSSLTPSRQLAEFQKLRDELHTTFAFGEGSLIRIALFSFGEEGHRVFISAHHLICDGLSIRILVEDLAAMYLSLAQRSQIKDELPTTGILALALRLNSEISLAQAVDEQSFWTPRRSGHIPLDFADGNQTMGSMEFVSAQLSPEQTKVLRAISLQQYKCGLDVPILWAEAACLMRWQNEYSIAINVVGHGRESIWTDIDLSRTVGWISVHNTLFLQLPVGLEPPDAVGIVARRLNAVAQSGRGYSILRHIYNFQHPNTKIPVQPEPQVFFNYLGDHDVLFKANRLFVLASEGAGAAMHPDGRWPYRVGLFCYVVDRCLHFKWFFSRNLHKKSTIESLNDSFIENLLRLFA